MLLAACALAALVFLPTVLKIWNQREKIIKWYRGESSGPTTINL